jgi:hypothetical protein
MSATLSGKRDTDSSNHTLQNSTLGANTMTTLSSALILCFPLFVLGTEVAESQLPTATTHLPSAHQSRSFRAKRTLSCASELCCCWTPGGKNQARRPQIYSPAHSPHPELKASKEPARSKELASASPNSIQERIMVPEETVQERDHIYTMLQKELYPALRF